jgi:hypothetical protein
MYVTVGFEVLTEIVMKNPIFWDMTKLHPASSWYLARLILPL